MEKGAKAPEADGSDPAAVKGAEGSCATADEGGKAENSAAAENSGAAAVAVEEAENSGAAAVAGEEAEVEDSATVKGKKVDAEGDDGAAAAKGKKIEAEEAQRRAAAEFEVATLLTSEASDDVVFKLRRESLFREAFVSALVKSTVPSHLESFRILRWSKLLVISNLLSKDQFKKVLGLQAIHCQFLMAGTAKCRRFCKRMIVSLLKSCERYRSYLDVVRVSTFHIEAWLFLKLIINYSVKRLTRYLEYKNILIDSYVRALFNSSDEPSEATNVAFKSLLVKMNPEDFEISPLYACLRTLGLDAQIPKLQAAKFLMQSLRLDMSEYCSKFMPNLLRQARQSDEHRRLAAVAIVGELSEKSRKPEKLSWMLDAVIAIIGGSEGSLSHPYERIGMIKALEQLSRSTAFVSGSETILQTSILAPSVSSSLITSYRTDEIKEVRQAILGALKSWVKASADCVQQDLVYLIKIGLAERDELRKCHLELIRVICKRPGTLTKVIPLFDQLMESARNGFSNATRIDGIYALFAVLSIAAVDSESAASLRNGANLRELIKKNGSVLISVQSLSELSDEDCCMVSDLLRSLLVDHISWTGELFDIHSLLELLIHLVCHQRGTVRMSAYNAAKKVLESSTKLAEDFLDIFIGWLSLVTKTKQNSNDNERINIQQSSIPVKEVLIKCLILIGPYVIHNFPRGYSKFMLCCHHSCVTNAAHPAAVWKRLVRSLKQQRIRPVNLVNTQYIINELMSHRDYQSNENVSDAVHKSLRTLARMTPTNAARHDQVPEGQPIRPAAVPPADPSNNVSPTTAGQKSSMIPMSDKAFINFLKAAANAAVGATTSANIYLATLPNTPNKIALGITLFGFLPWAVATAGIAHSAEDDDKWVECAATMVLVEFAYGFVLGGVAATAFPGKEGLVGCIAAVLVVAVFYIWSNVFPYPKWIKRIHMLSPYSSTVSEAAPAQDVAPPSFWSKIGKFLKWSKATQPREDQPVPASASRDHRVQIDEM